MEVRYRSRRAKLRQPIALPYVAAGFGDGNASVFGLRSGRRRVGMELEFLPSDFAFPEEIWG